MGGPKLLTIEERVSNVIHTLNLPESDREYLTGQFREAAGVGDRDYASHEVWVLDFRAWLQAAYPNRHWLSEEGDLDPDFIKVLKKGFRAGWRRAIMAARRRVTKAEGVEVRRRLGLFGKGEVEE